MLRLFLLLAFFHSLITFSQEENRYEDKGSVRHEVDILPAEVVFDNRDFFYGHGLNYTLSYKDRFRLNAYSRGVLFPKLDGREDQFKNNKVFPKLNHSGVELSYRTRLLYDCRPQVKQKVIDLVAGYNYFQYGTTYDGYNSLKFYWSDTVYSDASYWTVDSLSNGKVLSISGLKHYNLVAGVRYSIEKGRRSSHQIAAYYLYGVRLQLCGVEEGIDEVQSRTTVKNTFGIDRSGVKIQYIYHKWFGEKVGMTTGLITVLNPRLPYRSQNRFYIPRGGESLFPLFISVHLGVSFR